MNEKNDLELFYIHPYTKHYNSGGYYRNDETGCIDYLPSSEYYEYKKPLIFDDKEQLLNWFYKNVDKRIPTVYRIKYIGNYQGLDDVIKITNITTGGTGYYTTLNKERYVRYDRKSSEKTDKFFWIDALSYKCIFEFKYIYEELIKRGIKPKYNVYKEDIDKTNCFEYIGDPFYYSERTKAEGKKLVLYHEKKIFW